MIQETLPLSEVSEETLLHYESVIEAVLFAMGGAVEGSALAKACGCDTKTARKAARSLLEKREAENGALLVREYNGDFELCTNPRYHEELIRLVSVPKKPVLTDVVMETLSIIAFKSPATKLEIEQVRGVKSDHAVNRLVEYGLVEEVGRLDAPGRPALFAPTDEFYRRFGVSGKEDLPKLSPEVKETFAEEVQMELKDVLAEGEGAGGPDPERAADAPAGEGSAERRDKAGTDAAGIDTAGTGVADTDA